MRLCWLSMKLCVLGAKRSLVLELRIDHGADQDRDTGYLGPQHEAKHGAGRAVEPVIAADILDVPRHDAGAERPPKCRGRPACNRRRQNSSVK